MARVRAPALTRVLPLSWQPRKLACARLGKTVETCRRIAFAIDDQTLAKSPPRAARGRFTNAAACRRPLMRGQQPRGLARASPRRRGGARLSCERHADLTIRSRFTARVFFEQKARGRNAMTEKWKDESWAQDFWYSGKTTRRTRGRLGRQGRRARRHHAGAGAVARGLRRRQALQDRLASSRSRAPARSAARPRWSACRWRSTASTRTAASTAGRSRSWSPTTSPSPTSAAARSRSCWSRTRSTSTSAASSPTSASPACRCSRSTRSST